MSRENDGFEFHPTGLQRFLDAVYRVINIFVRWDRLPTLIGAFNIAAFRDRLRAHNLHHTGYGVDSAGEWKPGYERWRSADGSYNCLAHPRMGMARTRFGRNVPLTEAVPETDEALLEPSPRVISRELLARREFIAAPTLNLLAAAWIQFEIHNWFSHGPPQSGNEFKVPLPRGDDWPQKERFDGCMHIQRTAHDKSEREPWLGAAPTFRNFNSHWWDAGQLYGHDHATQMKIRSRRDGKIRFVRDGDREMLPEDPDSKGVDFTGFNDNWWIGLAVLHNLFALEHNAICDALKSAYPEWNDEELFQHARLINGALIAKIHTVEWTPGILRHPVLQFAMAAQWSGAPQRWLHLLLGEDNEVSRGIPGSATDQHSAPYAMTEEFTAVYRMHPLLPDTVRIHALKVKGDKPKALKGSKPITLNFVDVQGPVTRGLMKDHGFANVLYSLGIQNPGALRIRNYPNFLRQFKKAKRRNEADIPLMDMAAVDIMRDRERGVPRYNRFRELLGKKRVTSFEEITSSPDIADKMREIYKDVDRVDLLVGLMAEDLPEGFGFSDTAFRAFIVMASRRLKSDRFFTDDFRPEIYTELGMDWIHNNSMKSVLLRHFPELGQALEGINNSFSPWNIVAER
jgi:Animal haem peroxidase